MQFFFRLSVPVVLLVMACLLTVPAAQAQRAADGPPANDPFGRRVVPARAVPGERYLSHSFANNVLTIQATDGSARQIQPWTYDVIRIGYFAPGHRAVADSSISVVQKPYKWVLSEFSDHLGNKARYPPV